jgi:tetratricopeptide (TPR) repeat protein
LLDLLARRPARGDLWLLLGQAHLAENRPAEARAALERALALGVAEGQRQVAHDRLGLLCIESDVGCALEHWTAAARGPDPLLAEGAERLALALRSLDADEGQVDPALSRARLGEALYRHGELEAARRQFEAALALEPEYVDAHAYLGHVLSLLGEGQAAVEHLEGAIVLEPGYTLPRYFLGMHYARRGWHVTAREVLVQAHDLEPGNPAICAAVADTYLSGAESWYAVAERWLKAAVDNAPHDARFHLLLARFYVERGIDPGLRGVAVAQVAVDLAPQSSGALETLGWAYHLGGRSARALEPLQRALELAADGPGAQGITSARIHYRLGEVYRVTGQPELARQHLQAAIDLDWKGPIGERARQSMGQD